LEKAGKQERGKQERGKQEKGKQEKGKQEKGKQESGKQGRAFTRVHDLLVDRSSFASTNSSITT
jgi:hypothetical protein